MMWPVKYDRINEGYTNHPPALDLAAPEGREIVAPEDGVVVGINNNPAAYFGGNYIRLKSDSLIVYYMGHNSRNVVSLNERVREGQVIGYVGHTGQADGPHCHFESVVNGKGVDFRTIIKEGDDMNATKEQLIEIYKMAVPNQPVNNEWVKKYAGRDMSDAIQGLRDDPSRQGYITGIVNDADAYRKGGASSLNKDSVLNYIKENLK